MSKMERLLNHREERNIRKERRLNKIQKMFREYIEGRTQKILSDKHLIQTTNVDECVSADDVNKLKLNSAYGFINTKGEESYSATKKGYDEIKTLVGITNSNLNDILKDGILQYLIDNKGEANKILIIWDTIKNGTSTLIYRENFDSMLLSPTLVSFLKDLGIDVLYESQDTILIENGKYFKASASLKNVTYRYLDIDFNTLKSVELSELEVDEKKYVNIFGKIWDMELINLKNNSKRYTIEDINNIFKTIILSEVPNGELYNIKYDDNGVRYDGEFIRLCNDIGFDISESSETNITVRSRMNGLSYIMGKNLIN